MSRIRSKNTLPEKLMWALLKEMRTPPERWALMPGKPDFVFERAGVAVFVDGCFWHRCPKHLSKPKTNVDFWQNKFKTNVKRDAVVTAELQQSGWIVLRVWECEVKKDIDAVMYRVETEIEERLSELNDSWR